MANEKEQALKQLEKRRKKSAKTEQINNADLPIGAKMTFYCRVCGSVSDVKSESYTTPVKNLCYECKEMQDQGWIE